MLLVCEAVLSGLLQAVGMNQRLHDLLTTEAHVNQLRDDSHTIHKFVDNRHIKTQFHLLIFLSHSATNQLSVNYQATLLNESEPDHNHAIRLQTCPIVDTSYYSDVSIFQAVLYIFQCHDTLHIVFNRIYCSKFCICFNPLIQPDGIEG